MKTKEYLQQKFIYGGELLPLGTIIVDLQRISLNQQCVDRYLQGMFLKQRKGAVIMNKDIMKQMGFGEQVKKVETGECPTCSNSIDVTAFKDELSLKEFHISGMCQTCQDDFFC